MHPAGIHRRGGYHPPACLPLMTQGEVSVADRRKGLDSIHFLSHPSLPHGRSTTQKRLAFRQALSFKFLYYRVIILFFMGKDTVTAILYSASIGSRDILTPTAAILIHIKRAKTEQAIYPIHLVTRIKLALSVFKILIAHTTLGQQQPYGRVPHLCCRSEPYRCPAKLRE